MLSFLKKIPNSFISRSRLSAVESWCLDYFRARAANPSTAQKPTPLVLVEAVEDPFFYSLHAQIVSGLREIIPLRVGRWASRSLNPGASTSFRLFVVWRLDRWIQSRCKWKRLYNTICDEAGDRADYQRAPWR